MKVHASDKTKFWTICGRSIMPHTKITADLQQVDCKHCKKAIAITKARKKHWENYRAALREAE